MKVGQNKSVGGHSSEIHNIDVKNYKKYRNQACSKCLKTHKFCNNCISWGKRC